MSNIPNSTNLLDVFKSSVNTSTSIIHTVVKNQATYAMAIIAIPLYFKAVGKLYSGYAKFSVKNIINSSAILTAGKLIDKSLPVMDSGISKVNEIVNKLEKPKFYRRATASVECIYNLLGNIVGDISYNKGKMYGFKLSSRNLAKRLSQMLFNMVLYGMVLKYWETAFDPLFSTIIPDLTDYTKRKHRRALRGLIRIQELLGALVGFLSSDIIQKQSSMKNLKTMAKLTTLCGQVVILGGTFALLGYLATPIMLGSLAFRVLVWGFLGIFQSGSGDQKHYDQNKVKTLRKSTNAMRVLLKGLAALLTIMIAEKIIENLIELTTSIGDGKAVLIGILAMGSIFFALLGIIKIINLFKIKVSDNLQSIMSVLTSFVSAWAAAKIAETIAPIGENAKEVLLGMAVVSAVTIGLVGLFWVISLIKIKNNIENVIKVISLFITAWAAAKIAETIAPIGENAKEVLLGTSVICGVIMMLVSTFWLASLMIKGGKLMMVSIGMVALSVAVLWSFVTLAFAMIFAPFAIITMAAVLVVSTTAALIGLMWKPILKGSLAMIALGIALSVISSPLLVIGITGAILGSLLGTPELVLATMGAIAGFLLLFAGTAALVGLLMSTGLIVAGVAGMVLLGIAMLSIAVPLLIIAIAAKKLSEINLDGQENVIADVVTMMVNGIKVFFEEDNWKYLNPISLAYVMACMGQLMFITLSLGMMARVLRNIASLRIPTEWDSKGNPTKYEVLDTNSFISAGENATSILQFFTALFGDEPTVLSNGIVVGGAMNGLDKVTRSTRLKVKRLRKIVNYVGSMAKILQEIASLYIPVSYDADGKPTEFARMGARDFLTASLNAGGILMFFGSLFADTPTNLRVLGGEVRINPLSMDYLDNISRSTRRKIKRLKRIVGYVGDMAGILQKMAVLTVPNEIDPETGKVKSWRKMNSGDFENVSANIATITTTIISAMANNEVSGLLDSMSKRATKNFERVMSAISGISSVTNMIQMIAGGEIPTKFVTDPKDPNKRIPVEWVSFSKLLSDESIKTDIRSLFDVVIEACTYKGTNADDLKNASNSIDNIKKVMEGSSSCITVLVTSYKNNLSQLSEDEFTVRYDKITGTMSKLISIMGGQGVDVKKSREIQKNIKETTGLIKQIDNTNLDKLKYASDMMAHISRLSASIKGNFEGLADVINEKLVKAIEELKEQLEKLNNTPKSETTTPSPISKDMSQSGTPGALRKVTETNKPEPNKPAISIQDINEIKRNINEILGAIRGVIDVSGMCIKTKEQ